MSKTSQAPDFLQTHQRSMKSGNVIAAKPYRLHFSGSERFYEVPKGSGEFYYENGDPVPAELAPKLKPVVVPATQEHELDKLRKLRQDQDQRIKDLEAKLEAAAAPKEVKLENKEEGNGAADLKKKV
jgi:hypothetical protein